MHPSPLLARHLTTTGLILRLKENTAGLCLGCIGLLQKSCSTFYEEDVSCYYTHSKTRSEICYVKGVYESQQFHYNWAALTSILSLCSKNLNSTKSGLRFGNAWLSLGVSYFYSTPERYHETFERSSRLAVRIKAWDSSAFSIPYISANSAIKSMRRVAYAIPRPEKVTQCPGDLLALYIEATSVFSSPEFIKSSAFMQESSTKMPGSRRMSSQTCPCSKILSSSRSMSTTLLSRRNSLRRFPRAERWLRKSPAPIACFLYILNPLYCYESALPNHSRRRTMFCLRRLF